MNPTQIVHCIDRLRTLRLLPQAVRNQIERRAQNAIHLDQTISSYMMPERMNESGIIFLCGMDPIEDEAVWTTRVTPEILAELDASRVMLYFDTVEQSVRMTHNWTPAMGRVWWDQHGDVPKWMRREP